MRGTRRAASAARPRPDAPALATTQFSLVVVFELMSNGQDVDGRSIFNLVEDDVSRAAKWNDQFSQERALASLPKDEGSATQVAFDLCGDGVDRDLRSVEIFGGLSTVEQEIEEAEQIVAAVSV